MYLGAAERRTTTIGIGRGVYLMYVSMLEVNYMYCCYLLTLLPISAGSRREYVQLSIMEIIDCGMVF